MSTEKIIIKYRFGLAIGILAWIAGWFVLFFLYEQGMLTKLYYNINSDNQTVIFLARFFLVLGVMIVGGLGFLGALTCSRVVRIFGESIIISKYFGLIKKTYDIKNITKINYQPERLYITFADIYQVSISINGLETIGYHREVKKLIDLLSAGDRWHNLTEVTVVEHDDALYLERSQRDDVINLAVMSCLLVAFLFSSTYLGWSWSLALPMVAFASITLVEWRLYFIRRSRYPQGQLLAQVDQDTLLLALPGYVWPRKIQVPLSKLCSVMFLLPVFDRPSISLTLDDGQKKILHPLYSQEVGIKICDFIRRKLPSSVQFTLDLGMPKL